jgi:hypothetical protein
MAEMVVMEDLAAVASLVQEVQVALVEMAEMPETSGSVP